ncbi:DNA modification methylase [Microbacterium sp.]|uniref:DNA modification methylase n=1 Tax=Microbacterium sp. TaxID=51671 RepID=UPI00333FE16B
MKSRLAASIALCAVALFGTTGCTFITHQASTIAYSASDGVNINDESGPVKVRNAMIIANEDGSVGNFVAGIINDTDSSQTLHITVGDLPAIAVKVPAGGSLKLGADEEPLRIDGLDVKAGANVKVFFQSGDSTGRADEVPVLDGALPYYADLVPTEAPTPLPTETDKPTS